MHSLLILIVAALASFAGSLQLGPVNLYVIETTLCRNKRSAYFAAAGGSVPELIYCALAIYFGSLVFKFSTAFLIFRLLLIVILCAIGIFYLLKKPNSTKTNEDDQIPGSANHFAKGFILAGLNPQLLPFWIFILVYFNSVKYLMVKSMFNKLAYIAGAGLGAFLLLSVIIVSISWFKSRILNYLNHRYYFKIMAILFFALAAQQLVSI